MNIALIIVCICGAVFSEQELFSYGWLNGRKPPRIENEAVGFECLQCGKFIHHRENNCPMENHTHKEDL